MLTKLRVRNFKRFQDAEIELGGSVVFVGPNNSGKTSALQALALWNLGVNRLSERYGEKDPPEKRPGLAINRKDLIAVPVPTSNMLWRNAHAFWKTQRVRIEIVVDGVNEGAAWSCGLEFDYDNEESFTCRPLRLSETDKHPPRMTIPAAARQQKLAFLPPMSGLVSTETRLEPGAVAVRIGEGRTAEVLRNLCHQIYSSKPEDWNKLTARISHLFGVELDAPLHRVERGEIEMTYRENGVRLDLSSVGRGVQQTLLLLAYLQANPGAILLLDEPDAHLEVLRQSQIYELLTSIAEEQGSQIVAASHSEVILNEAADRDIVIAFVGRPHRIDDRGLVQVRKALKEIGFDQYYQAERKGWVLYLEGSTDLAILRAWAEKINHPAAGDLERPFSKYVGNQPKQARSHFFGLQEAKRDLVGIALFDRDVSVETRGTLSEMTWRRNEIENYLCAPEVLYAYAEKSGAEGSVGPLFSASEARRRRELMQDVVRRNVPPAALEDPTHRFWIDVKATDAYLDPVFKEYFERLSLPNLMRKTDYHQLARLMPADAIDAEVREKLDAIHATARGATPLQDESANSPTDET